MTASRRRAALVALLFLAGCAPGAAAPRCDFRNHSGVCEELATPAEQAEARAILEGLRARAVAGDVVLYPHLNDPHDPAGAR